MEFIKTCPFLDEYHIDISEMSVRKLIKDKPEGSALDYVGSMEITGYKDLIKNRFTTRQANFQLWLLRDTKYDVDREEIADFLFNFEQWIEYCQSYNLCPKLSVNKNDKHDEIMTADNGIYFSEWEGIESSLYLIQIHIKYFNQYSDVS
jgi:hypothetical protein